MTVDELRVALHNLPGHLKVYIAVDEEGNGFHTIGAAQKEWVQIDGRDVDVIHPDDVGTEYDEADCSKAVVLWP